MTRRLDVTVLTALMLGLFWGYGVPAPAETLRYDLEIPERDSVTYLLDLDVRHPGKLTVRAEWSGSRNVSLKLIPPHQPYGALLRSGPSPQALETTIAAERFEPGLWTLRVFALSGRGAGQGSLVIELPSPEAEMAPEKAEESTATDGPEPQPWMQPFRPASAVRSGVYCM